MHDSTIFEKAGFVYLFILPFWGKGEVSKSLRLD